MARAGSGGGTVGSIPAQTEALHGLVRLEYLCIMIVREVLELLEKVDAALTGRRIRRLAANPVRVRPHRSSLVLGLLALLPLAACNDTFDPVQHGGPPFSIFGVLDAGADTQWIRVNGLRSTLLPSSTATGYEVMLQNLGSGRVIALRDSGMLYAKSSMLGGADSVYAHNFWTAERLEPGADYRLRTRSGENAVAEAEVELPRDYRMEHWIPQMQWKYDRPGPDLLWLGGVKQLAFVGIYRTYFDQCTAETVEGGLTPQPVGGDTVSRTVGIGNDTAGTSRVAGRPCGDKYYTRKEIEVVAAGAPWPFGQDYTTWRLNPTASNISNAFGFVGGVFIKRLPYERCEWDGYTSVERYCKLRYDSTTARLRGSILSTCPLNPDSARATLRELDPAPTEPLPRIRRAYVDAAGHYEIGAIRPGVRHELSLTGGIGSWAWSSYTDTLVFTPGQHVVHTATLDWVLRLGKCLW